MKLLHDELLHGCCKEEGEEGRREGGVSEGDEKRKTIGVHHHACETCKPDIQETKHRKTNEELTRKALTNSVKSDGGGISYVNT